MTRTPPTRALTRAEEVELFEIYHRGRKPKATKRQVAASIRAADKICAVTRGLARFTAEKYRYRTTVEYEDLVAAGELGIVRALPYYEPKRGLYFSTFALWHIRGCILELIARNLGICRGGSGGQRVFLNLGRAERILAAHGKPETAENIAEAVNASLASRGAGPNKFVNVETVVAVLGRVKNTDLRLDAMIKGGDEAIGARWGLKTDSPEAMLANEQEAKQIKTGVRRALFRLKPKEAEIISRRFGINKYGQHAEPETLKEIGDSLGICRERVRQLEVIAMKKLKRLMSNTLDSELLATNNR